jgi:hypothetical protein
MNISYNNMSNATYLEGNPGDFPYPFAGEGVFGENGQATDPL